MLSPKQSQVQEGKKSITLQVRLDMISNLPVLRTADKDSNTQQLIDEQTSRNVALCIRVDGDLSYN
jgi:hypothetical protein